MSQQLGDWLESYATSLDLDVLTSTPVVRATHDEKTGSWTVVARRSSDGKERTFNVKHVVLAVGLGEGWSKIPEYKGLVSMTGHGSCLFCTDVMAIGYVRWEGLTLV